MRDGAPGANRDCTSGHSIKTTLLASAALCLVVGAGLPGPANAQNATTQTVSLNIRSQDLGSALTALADRAGLRLLLPSSLVAGRISPPLSGTFTREQALSRLLAGTGLSYSFTNANTVTITDRVAAAHDGVAPATDGSLVLDTINVQGAKDGFSENTPYETAGSSNYISGETIERFRGSSPSDIFRGTPGVMSGESRNSGGVDVNIRGLQGYGRVAVTIDGAQQASVSDRGYFGDANSTMIDPNLLGGVSITKGPSNDPGASGAIAGHVAMNTITADDIVPEGKTWGIRVKGGFSTNSKSPPATGTWGGSGVSSQSRIVETNFPGESVEEVPTDFGERPLGARPDWWLPTGGNGSVAIATKQENFEAVAAFSHRERGNYFAGTHGDHARVGETGEGIYSQTVDQEQIDLLDIYYPGHGLKVGDILSSKTLWYGNIGSTVYRPGEEVLNTSNVLTSGLLKGVLTLDGGHRFELGYMRSETEYGFAWPTNYLTLGNHQFQNELAQASADMVTGKYRYNPDDSDLIDISLNGWYTRQRVHEVANTDMLRADGLPRSQYNSDLTNTDAPMVGFDLSNRSLLASAWGDVSLRYGLAYLMQDVDVHKNHMEFRNGTPRVNTPYDESNRRQQWDVFIDGSWKPTDWLKLDAGLRYMTARTEYGWNGVNLSEPPTKQSSDGLAPNVSVTVEPLDGLQFYGTYKQGWRAPSFKEVMSFSPYAVARDYTGGVTNGAALKDEHSTNYEIGANLLRNDVFQVGDTLGLKASYFVNDVDDYITNVYGLTDRTTVSTTMNFDRVSYSGVEFSARYDSDMFFGEAGAIYYDKIKQCPRGNVCYVSGSEDGLDQNKWRNHIPPEYSLSLTAGMRLFDQKLTLAGRVTYNSESAGQPAKHVDPWVNSLWWKAYALVDVYGSYKFNDAVTLDFAVENLFDKYYKDPLANVSQPGPGRTFRMNMTAKF